MIKIAFLNQKGGVGKTTSVVNIASTLVKHFNKKVLIVDCDVQRNASEYLLTFAEDEVPTLYDYFNNDISIEQVVTRISTKIKGKIEPINLYLISSDELLSTIKLPSVKTIKEILVPLEKKFDYCLFDLPPQFSGPSSEALFSDSEDDIEGASVALGALVASDYVIAPSVATRFSVSGFNDFLNSVQAIRRKRWNLDLYLLGIMFNNVISRRGLEKHITTTVKDNMDSVFKNQIKASSEIEQAEYFGIPIAYYSGGNTSAASEYKALTKEILKRIKEKEKR